MRRLLIISASILLAQIMAVAALAHQAPQPAPQKSAGVEGRWTGTIKTPDGDNDTGATFKKEGDGFAGTFVGPGGQDIAFKTIKVDGDKITATAEVETPQGKLTVNFSFTLKDDTLKGKAEVDLGGQPLSLEINLKRATDK